MRFRQLFSGIVTSWVLASGSAAVGVEIPPELERWLAPQAWQRDTTGPIVSLGPSGDFDDMHLFAPAVADRDGQFWLWYSGSRGARNERVFRLGLARSPDGKQFEKFDGNPVLEMSDGSHSILTPAVLRNPDGTLLLENGKLRMWFSSAELGKSGLHTLHETTSPDGIHWSDPSPPLLENAYCPTILKTGQSYEMWFSDVSQRPWLIRHATSNDGTQWKVTQRPVLQLSQLWEAEVLVYPTVLKIDGVYLMWYGSYNTAVRRQTTAIGFAVSGDGLKWHKHPQNPVISPDPARLWESNYVGSGCVMRLADGSYRYWYAGRTKPPFEHLYFAINTARWAGPSTSAEPSLALPPIRGAVGRLGAGAVESDGRQRRVDVLEIIDPQNVIVRAWYLPGSQAAPDRTVADDPTFVDLWLQGVDTRELTPERSVTFDQVFEVVGNKSFETTCGGRSVPLLKSRGSAAKRKSAE